jgi:hypothetical protein
MSTTELIQTRAVMIVESDIPPDMSIAEYRRRLARERAEGRRSIVARALAVIGRQESDQADRSSFA